MKKALLKLAVFFCVFVVSALIISAMMNRGNTDMTAEMGAATLPVMTLGAGEYRINPMYGYISPMDTAGMREGITLLGENRQVNAYVQTYGQKIESARYEVRSVDGERLVENTPMGLAAGGEAGELTASFRIKDLIELGEEYSLIFILTLEDGREVRYYSRIRQTEYGVEDKLDFVMRFSDATFDEEALKEYRSKLEPTQDADNSTLGRVNIHSSLSQVAWGGLAVERASEISTLVREVSPQMASVVLSYLVRYPENGEESLAQVEEYYRVRCTQDNEYLLDYERTVEQILQEEQGRFVNGKISLGITAPELEMMESDGGSVFAFSQAGTLYSYNGANSSLARLFSFSDETHAGARERNASHGFKILQVDETGNVTFLVHGYMNRGRHEGRCGVQVCYYSGTLNVVEEMAFIPYDRSPDILAADMENLAYVNGKNDLYLMLDGSIHHVGLNDMASSPVAEGLDEDSYRAAAEAGLLVWQEKADGPLTFMDLNSGEKTQIAPESGQYLRPLGFMGEDLIYGVADRADVREDAAGDETFPMHSIVILGADGQVRKTYAQPGVYVVSCEISENQIGLSRVVKAGDGYEETQPDQIVYSEKLPENKNHVETAVTENLKRVAQIVLRSHVESKKVKFLTPKEILFEGSRDVELEETGHPERFFIYGKKGVVDILSAPGAAVRLAHENAGAVTAEDGSYVYARDRLHTSNQIMAITGEQMQEGQTSLEVCLNAMLRFEGQMRDSASMLEAGMDVTEILEESLPERRALSLYGVSLDMALYYPDREIPVLALLENGSAVLITGFNEHNVVIMNPQDGTVAKMGMNDARSWFEENGNRFIAYR